MSQGKIRTMSLYTATCLVVANMVGVGVFTSVGYQIAGGLTPFVILMLWLVGGVCAFCGGVAYAELAAALPRSGGEYHFLTRIFHPSVGFLAGWVSITAGFAAPVAVGAIAFGNYIHRIRPALGALPLAFAALVFITVVMLVSATLRKWFQNVSTSLSFLAILVFLGIGFFAPAHGSALVPQAGDTARLFSPGFATSLIYVMFAYAGWNASTYVTAEVRNPSRNVPLSMALGTVIVTVLYIAMNAIFLRAAPAAELSGQNEVGLIAGTHVFGATGGKWMALLIAAGLLAHIGSMQWIGPRVTATMGEDTRVLRPFSIVNTGGIPIYATLAQTAIAAFMLATGSFKSVLTYVQFTITLCSALVVIGVFVLRVREPNLPRPVRAWGYPVTPAIFLIVNGWMLWHVFAENPKESLAGLGTILSGLVVFYLSPKQKK
ncbi:MAG: amino acid permease [Verrucomicrobia bacterium]|jgi:APA family basic amino acid/polyamine antiporter|nr:amino acid permease [Verrucomicrobiota bacterium]